MANISKLAKKRKGSIFSGNNSEFNYQSIRGMANPKAYASADRDAIVGGIPSQPEELIYPQTTLVVGQSTDGYLSYYLLDYENKAITDTIKLSYRFDPTNGDDTSMFPLNYGGYLILLYRSNENDYVYTFIDVNGNVIESYDSSDNNSWDTLYGKWVYFIDYAGGVAKFYNGKTVITKNFNLPDEELFVYWDWDATSKNGSIFINLSNYNTNESFISKLDQEGIETQILTYDNSIYYYDISQANTGDFTVFLLRNDDNQGEVINLAIYSHKTNAFIQNVVLVDQVYSSYNYDHYDTNKYIIVLNDNNDSNVDYKIIQYDGNTNTLLTTTHAKGTSYPSYRIYADSVNADYPNANNCKNASILFYYSDGQTGNLDELTYADFLTFIDGVSSINTYTFSNDETGKFIATSYGSIHEYLSIPVINNNGNLSVLTLNGTTNPITTLGSYPTVYDSNSLSDYISFGNNFMLLVTNQSYGSYDAFIINNSGSIATSQLDINNYSYYEGTNLVYLSGDSNNNEGWYYNDSVQSFTSIGYYNIKNIGNYITEDGYAPRQMLLANNNDSANTRCRILGDTYISSEFLLPEWSDNVFFQSGKNNFLYIYDRPSDSQFIIEVYDFSIQLVNSVVTEFNFNSNYSQYNSRYYGNRGIFWLERSDDYSCEYYYPYLITPESIVYNGKSIYNDNSRSDVYSFNDYVSYSNWY